MRAEYQSARWRSLARRAKLRDGVCQWDGCDVSDRLQAHHLTYARAGAERLSDLVSLCDLHHVATELMRCCSFCGNEMEADPEVATVLAASGVRPGDRECVTCDHIFGWP